ncbi:HDOD domain-containing protein [Desulfovibrio sp. OttesenSCG-928-A18]|nr:HDOD domain-containing protein [Desulfovibrio sp. OttesenSCG-928-A18]
MEILDIDSISPGRRLARAVYSGEGKLLLPPGETITQEHLRMLKEWGFSSIAVEERAVPGKETMMEEQPEDIMEAVRETVMERFQRLDMNDAHNQVLFDRAIERQSRFMLSKSGKIQRGSKPLPAFQTERPPRVALQPLLDSSQRMGTLPTIFHHLVEMINDPRASTDDIARVISTDPALSAKLLKLVNSPFYGLAQKIDTIFRAVVLVGTRQLVMLAMGATLVTAFKGIPTSLVNMQSFWAHSISCGVCARQLARFAGATQFEGYFVSGLLHDIGKLLIYTQLPAHTLYILTEAKRQQIPVNELERETLGFSHEKLGGKLLESWRCPAELAERVTRHHEKLTEKSTVEEVILPIANAIVQALGYGTSGELFIPPLAALAWDKIGMSPEELQEQCTILDEKVREVRSFFALN